MSTSSCIIENETCIFSRVSSERELSRKKSENFYSYFANFFAKFQKPYGILWEKKVTMSWFLLISAKFRIDLLHKKKQHVREKNAKFQENKQKISQLFSKFPHLVFFVIIFCETDKREIFTVWEIMRNNFSISLKTPIGFKMGKSLWTKQKKTINFMLHYWDKVLAIISI